MKKARLVRQRRHDAWLAMMSVLRPEPGGDAIELVPPLRLDYHIYWEKGRRIMDDDNARASMKAIQDGIADAIGVDDVRFLQGNMVQEETQTPAGAIAVVVTEVGEDGDA